VAKHKFCISLCTNNFTCIIYRSVSGNS